MKEDKVAYFFGSVYYRHPPYTYLVADLSSLTRIIAPQSLPYLWQNYPNPFNPTTVISYQVPTICKVTLKIYDILGREVKTLVEERETTGQHVVYWDGTDRYGRRVASGVYYYRLTTPSGSITKKAVLLK